MRSVLADAAELARRALVDLEPGAVGAHLGVAGEGEDAATHHFEATLAGYRGWQWAVVVAAPPDATHATVSESALLPGPDALTAPEFVPWADRIRPGDLNPGDLLGTPADDPRLVPGYMASGDSELDEPVAEIGMGRKQVLGPLGREEAAERWYSEFGPDTDMAKAAPGSCATCGFFLPLAGSLRAVFGVCGNALGADGRVVARNYGCGAHSDTVLPTGAGSPKYDPYDDAALELVPAAERARRATGTPDAGDRQETAEAEAVEAAGTGSGENPTAAPANEVADVAADSGTSAVAADADTPAATATAAGAEVEAVTAAGGSAAEPTAVEPTGEGLSGDLAQASETPVTN